MNIKVLSYRDFKCVNKLTPSTHLKYQTISTSSKI